MKRTDDRTKEQQKTHTYLVTATDNFMSQWGQAQGGPSRCAWACDSLETAMIVLSWARSRNDMKHVRLTTKVRCTQADHVHIYVVDETHPAVNQMHVKEETKEDANRMNWFDREKLAIDYSNMDTFH